MRNTALILCLLTFFASYPSFSQKAKLRVDENTTPIRVGVPYFPEFSDNLDAALPFFIQRLGQVMDQEFDIVIYPFARSFKYLNEGQIDVHIPFIYIPQENENEFAYTYSKDALWTTNFIICTYKDKVFNINDDKKLNLYSDYVHYKLFDFRVLPISNIENAIKMVDKNRIDGVIFSSNVVDEVIRKYNLKNIRRTLFYEYDVKFIIAKGERAPYVSKVINLGVKKLKALGEFDELVKYFITPYQNWQPYIPMKAGLNRPHNAN